jgi:putative SOS response-associated peptidase YedK
MGKTKTPFCFTMADDSIFAFAGIWEQWKNPEGNIVETCSIITTTPNALCADVHDRMPAILPDEAYDLWLDPGFQKTDAVCDLLKPFDPALMRRYEVSSRVNLVKNNDAACAEPVVRLGAAGTDKAENIGPSSMRDSSEGGDEVLRMDEFGKHFALVPLS